MVPGPGLVGRELRERVVAVDAVLQEHGLAAAEREHLVAVPAEPDGDPGSRLDQLRRFEAEATPVVSLEQVHDLSAVASDAAAARHAEPLRVLGEELPELTGVAGGGRREGLRDAFADQSWIRAVKSRRRSTFWFVPPRRAS